MNIFDAVVIGGGPAGMTAALYLARAGVKALMLEKLTPGGQVLMTEEIENYPGFPKGLKGYELVDLFTAHLDGYELERKSGEVSEIRVGNPVHEIVVDGETIGAKSIILCSGAQYRRLGVPGEQEFTGRGVSYCAICDGNFFRDQHVAVIGGGNSALEEALYLARLVKKLDLIHRRDDFRGALCYQNKCFTHEKINVVRSTVVEEIVGGQAGVEKLVLKNVNTGETFDHPVDGVFIFVGFEPVMGFVPDAVEKDKNGIVTDTEMRTSVPGIFAAGDIRSKHCRQVASAVGDGATAATAAFSYLEQLDG